MLLCCYVCGVAGVGRMVTMMLDRLSRNGNSGGCKVDGLYSLFLVGVVVARV